jgi:hypothetical protein
METPPTATAETKGASLDDDSGVNENRLGNDVVAQLLAPHNMLTIDRMPAIDRMDPREGDEDGASGAEDELLGQSSYDDNDEYGAAEHPADSSPKAEQVAMVGDVEELSMQSQHTQLESPNTGVVLELPVTSQLPVPELADVQIVDPMVWGLDDSNDDSDDDSVEKPDSRSNKTGAASAEKPKKPVADENFVCPKTDEDNGTCGATGGQDAGDKCDFSGGAARMHGLSAKGRGLSAKGRGLSAKGRRLSAKGRGLSAKGRRLSAEGRGLSAERHGISATGRQHSVQGAAPLRGGGLDDGNGKDDDGEHLFESVLRRPMISMLLAKRHMSEAECARRLCACDFSACTFPCDQEAAMLQRLARFPSYEHTVRDFVRRLYPVLQMQ